MIQSIIPYYDRAYKRWFETESEDRFWSVVNKHIKLIALEKDINEDKYILNPEWEKKQLEQSITALENQIQSLTNILTEQQTLLEKRRKELKNLESKK